MLKLTKIKRTNDYIEAFYNPEDSNEEGYIKIDIKTDKIIEKKITSFDNTVATYFIMARNKLWKIKNEADIPEKLTVMWY